MVTQDDLKDFQPGDRIRFRNHSKLLEGDYQGLGTIPRQCDAASTYVKMSNVTVTLDYTNSKPAVYSASYCSEFKVSNYHLVDLVTD